MGCSVSARLKGVPVADRNEERGDVGAGGYLQEPTSTERFGQVLCADYIHSSCTGAKFDAERVPREGWDIHDYVFLKFCATHGL